MNKIINAILGFFIFIIPTLVQAQLRSRELGTETATSYIATEQLSLLQKVFNIITRPETVMVISVVFIIAFIIFVYFVIGFIIFLFINNKK